MSTIQPAAASAADNSTPGTSSSAAVLNNITDILWNVLPPVLLVLGTFGNVMTVVVMRGMRSSQSTACLSVYFTALAVSDQCLLLPTVLWYWVDMVFVWPVSYFRHDLLCTVPYTIMYMFSVTSAWFLVAMTYQRVTSVVAPHRVGVLCTVRRGKIIVTVIVVVASVVNLHSLYSWQYQPEYGYCLPRDHLVYFIDVFTWLDLALASAIPFLFLAVGNSILVWHVIGAVRLSRQMTAATVNPQTSSGSGKVNTMTRTLILTSSAFLLLSFPTCVYDVYERANVDLDTIDGGSEAKRLFAETVTLFLWFSVCATNFYLYLLSGSKFRQEARRYLCWSSSGRQK